MSPKSMNYYVADELANKVRFLHIALSQAEDIISKLEEENKRLQDVLINLASENNKGYVLDSEAFNEPVCAA
jgi:hypothetical protein